jgi:predicted metal-dependent peptidase
MGGGGTDMRVGFAAVEALRPKSDMVVMITDCYTPWPEVRPKIGKIVIVAVGDHGEPPAWEHRFVRILRPDQDEAAA